MYFNDEEFKRYMVVAGIVIAILGWGLVEVLVRAFSYITISIG